MDLNTVDADGGLPVNADAFRLLRNMESHPIDASRGASSSVVKNSDCPSLVDVNPRVDESIDKPKAWELLEINQLSQCRSFRLPDSISPMRICRLIYTNSGFAILALASNAVHKRWKRKRNDPSNSGQATASVLPQPWQPQSGILMTNDLSDTNPEDAVSCFAISKNNSYVMSASGGKISLFNMMAFKTMRTFMPPPPAATFLAFHPRDNNIIAIGMEDSTIQIYNVRDDEVKIKFIGHQKRITGLAFSTALNVLVSSGADGQLCVWSMDGWEKLTSKYLHTLGGNPSSDTHVQFHQDQTHLLVVHSTKIAIYEAPKLECLKQWFPQERGPITHAAYSCDSKSIYVSFEDGSVSVLTAPSLRLRCRINPSAYLPSFPSVRVYPSVIAAHPSEPNQFALGLTDGGVCVLEPLESEGQWGTAPPENASGTRCATTMAYPTIHFAAREGHTEMCDYLLEELKLDVNVKDANGETPLLHAARRGKTHTAIYLLEHGADPNVTSNLGATALHHAAGIGDIELLKFLLSKGTIVDSESAAGTPLVWAAGHVQKDAVQALLEHHANPNAETDGGITPLLSAVAAGSKDCLQLLIKAGANVNITAGGVTPLHIAADGGNADLINCLINVGADPNMADAYGHKPIQVAAERGNRRAVEILFPMTTPIQSLPSWSVDGIIEHMQAETSRELDLAKRFEEVNVNKYADLRKRYLPKVTPEVKANAAEAKVRGYDAFRRKDFQSAVDAYTQAIDFDGSDGVLYSNRSLCWLRVGQAEQALEDAKMCRALRPDWYKACYREGAALHLLQRFEEAANAFYDGVKLEPESWELVDAFREALDAGRKFHNKDEPTNQAIVE